MNEEKKKINTGIDYKNKKYRPNVLINKDRQPDIEKRFKELGYRSFNEYVIALINKDIGGR